MRKKEMIRRLYELEVQIKNLEKESAAGWPFLTVVGDGFLSGSWPTKTQLGPFPRIDNIPIVKVVEKILKHLKLELKVTPSKKESIEITPISVKNPTKGK